MTKRIPLRWPKAGVSDDQAHGKPAPFTTPDALNVRTLHHGRSQGAQRPGWSNFSSSALVPGKAVDAVASVAVDLPKVQYFGPGDSQIRRVWGHTVPGLRSALAVDVDTEGNLYVLDDAGTFEKIGPDGEVASTTNFATPQLESVVPRIALDFDGNVYVGTTNADGYSSRVLKFERLDDETFTRVWEYTGLWGIRDFQVGEGIMAVARHYPVGEDQKPADVIVMGELYGDGPLEFHTAAVPDPISAVDLTPSGEVLFAAAQNLKRNLPTPGEGWVDVHEEWSPHELEEVSGSGASSRIHFWIDANTLLEDQVNGDSVKQVLDRRWLQTTQDETDLENGMMAPSGDFTYVPPTDLVSRHMVLDRWTMFWPPELRANGANTKPSIRFGHNGERPPWRNTDTYSSNGTFLSHLDAKVGHMTGSQLICGQVQANHGPKEDLDDPLNGTANKEGRMLGQATPIPSHENAVFTTFFVVRYHFRDKAEVMFHHRSRYGVEYAIIFNADTADVHAIPNYAYKDHTSGSVSLFIGNTGGLDASLNPLAPTVGITGGGGGGGACYSADLGHADYANDQQIAIIAVQHEGIAAIRPINALGMFRVNGRNVDVFSSSTGRAEAAFTGSSFGTTTDEKNVNTFSHMNSWEGDLLECITILGSTAVETAPNQVPVSWPGLTVAPVIVGSEWTDVTGEDYTVDAQAYTDAASEVERMEGWLAYKWGSGNILPGLLATATGLGGFQDAHPFAYTSSDGVNFDEPRWPIGSSTAGGQLIGDTGSALISNKEILGKIGSAGKVLWALEGGGHGLGVKSGPDNSVYSVGRHDKLAGDVTIAKRLKDLGSGVRATGEDTWALNDSKENIANVPVPGMAIDDGGNLYWPRTPQRDFMVFEIVLHLAGAAIHTTRSYPPSGALPVGQVYIWDNLPTGTGAGVEKGLTILDMGTNLVAAINGTSSTAQAEHTSADNYFTAFLVRTGGRVFVRLERKGNDPGKALYALQDPAPGATVQITELSPGTTYVDINQDSVHMDLGPNDSLIEVRAAEDGKRIWTKTYTAPEAVLALAVDPELPLYPTDHALEDFPEHVYAGVKANVLASGATSETPTSANFEKLRQVERRQVIEQDRSPRKTVHVATCDGSFYTVAKGKPPKLVNNGGRVFNPGSPFAKLFTYRQKVYGIDGLNYIVYDPKTNLMGEWKAEGAGKIPPGAKLAAVWSQRITLSRSNDDPHNLYLSGRGKPDDWDTSPKVLTPLSAFTGDGGGNLAFRTHDLVNCLIPARDDLLIIGGDKSISRLTGDPGGGGQLDNITTGEGLAFGDAYCVAPDGTVFAKGTNGGVWRLGVSGSADRISLDSIERRLQDIDQSEYDVRMVWNFRQEGLHVFVVPKGLGKRIVTHWFWDSKEAGWWPDEFAITGLQPTAAGIFDGDKAADRDVVMGCEDGFVRFEDEDAKDDAGTRILSHCVVGPIVPDDVAGQLAFSHLEPTLASDLDGVDLALYLGEVSDVVAGGKPAYSRRALPGYNGYMLCRGRSNQAWVRLGNAGLSESWALESLYIRVRGAGRRRMI